jgi:hypothetical protein
LPITIPGRGYDLVIGQTENNIIVFYDSIAQVTDCYVIKINEEDGNVDGITFFKTFNYRLRVVIGKGDKFVCDTYVF